MSKKLILFLMVLLFGSTSFLRADELTVCDGTETNTSVPVYGLYADAYLKCHYVMPADQLTAMNGGVINSMTFEMASPAAAPWTGTFQVFMTEVDYTEISAFVDETSAVTVYTGTLDATGATMTVTFDTPYSYEGGNLLIGFNLIQIGNYKSASFNGVTATGASVQGYSYSALSAITPAQRNFLPKTTFVFESGTVPPVPPTGELTITPNDFTLGERPANGWMEPLSVRINNSAEPVTVTATLSNTSGVGAITMEPALIQDLTLETGDEVALTISTATGVTAGEYAEEFTMFTVNAKNIATIPVTATLYTAGEADIVETAKNINAASFTETPADLKANYNLPGIDGMTLDAVYQFTLTKDMKFTVNGGTFIGIYNKVSDFHPTATVEPIVMTTTGSISNQILLAGQYYMIVAGDAIATVEGSATELPEPTAITNIAPANFATGIEGNSVELTWEGGENAAEYQVLFGTSPTNTTVALDWTVVDKNYGSYTATGLVANTQYFWQIKVRNSNGSVTGPRWGFTTALTAPNTVTASATEIFTDESTLIKWKHSSGTMGDLPETQIGSGTSTNSYLPTYNFYNYSLSEQIYTSEELGGEAGYINSISFYPVGAITRNLKVYLANTDKETFTSGSDWVAMTEENLVYEGNVAMVANTWVTINFADAFEYEGGNLILAVTDHTGTYTSSIYYNTFDATAQAINVYQDSAPYNALAPVGDGTVRDFKNQIIINKDGAKGNTANRAVIGYNVYYGDVKANDALLTEKQFLLENLPYNMTGHDINVTAVYDEGESGHSTPIVTVKVSGYATLEGTVTTLATEQGGNEPLAGATVTFYGKDEFDNDVNFETTTDDNGYYSVTVKAGIYNRGVATYAGMEPASMAEESVTVAYEGTETVNFIIHEEYKPVLSVYAEEINPSMSKVTWSLNTVISGGGSGGNASTFTEGFEGGMPEGWTVVDANNDGYTWCLTSAIPTTWTYYASLTLDWYRTGTNAICSGSYINGAGALNPDEYLIMGQQNIANGSTLSFWAAATDASYPADHFGVAVSDDATTWTMVQEWTLTGKEGAANGGRASRDGNGAKLGTWYNYTVDLSAYAGQKYIAIRHFNCYDQYIMCVDDIELAAASKDRSLDHYAVYRKAILKENEIVPADSVMLVDGYTDTLYADFDWNNVEPGLYQYGVQAVYPTPIEAKGGNRDEIVIGDPTATTTNSYLPTYSLYEYSLTEQIYTADEIGMAGTINTLTMWLKNSSSYARNINVYMKEADVVTFADGNAWVSMEDSDMVASFTLANGISSPVETAIALNTPFNYSGNGNLVICFQDVTGSWSSGAASVVMTGNGNQAIYAYRDGTVYNPTTPGVTGNVTTNKSVIMLDITPGGGNDNPVTPITWSNILPKDMETTVTVNAVVAAGSPEGATVIMTNTFENVAFTAEFDETGTVVFPEFRKGNYVVTVDLEGYTSDYAEREVSIWDETELTATLTEIYKPVEEITVSVTGYAMWTPIVPVDRIAEKYFVQLNGVYYGETTDNFMQIDEDVLIENEQYTVGVAVVYSTGMSAYVTKNFTYLGCEGVATQVEELAATNEPGDLNVILTWNGGTPTPPPTPPTGDVTIVLQADDVWGDGSGYQMLLDDTHSLYGTTIPETGALSLNCTGNDAIYAQFSHKIPTNADGNCSTSNMVNNSSVSITIPAGTYDWCITNPTPGDRIWIASSGGTIGGRYNDYTFEAGYTYTFHVYFGGANDATDLTITGGKGMYQPNMGIMSNDVRTTGETLSGDIANAGKGFGPSATNMTRDWNYYDTGNNDDAIGLTAGGGFYWGIMFPANTYEGTVVSKIAYFDYTAHTGSFMIYNGGDAAPGTLLYTQAYSVSGTSQYIEIELDEAVTIDNAQNLWLVMHNNNGQYVAAIDESAGGAANASCISTDGSTWYNTVSAASGGSIVGNWNLRIYTEAGGPAPVTPTGSITPNAFNIAVDDIDNIVGAVTANTAVITAEDYEMHTYYVFYVDAQYGISCPAAVDYQCEPEAIEENAIVNAIYPNPTSGDLHINATAMKHISIINTMGQVVYNQDVNNDETVINMAKFESGVYMVNIITENGSSVKRVTVTK